MIPLSCAHNAHVFASRKQRAQFPFPTSLPFPFLLKYARECLPNIFIVFFLSFLLLCYHSAFQLPVSLIFPRFYNGMSSLHSQCPEPASQGDLYASAAQPDHPDVLRQPLVFRFLLRGHGAILHAPVPAPLHTAGHTSLRRAPQGARPTCMCV